MEIGTADLEQGQLHRLPSYVNPWSLHEIDHEDIHKRVAELSPKKQREVATQIHHFVDVP